MKNEVVKSLMNINRKIEMLDLRKQSNSIEEVIKNLENEIKFLGEKFELNDIEALLFATICIYIVDNSNREADLDDIARFLDVTSLEILYHKSSLDTLIKKELIKTCPKECRNRNCNKSEINFLDEAFKLNEKVVTSFNA